MALNEEWDSSQMAVVAVRQGDGVVLWYSGEQSNTNDCRFADLWLDDAPDGISIWTGGPSFRSPTDAEWQSIRESKNPWQ